MQVFYYVWAPGCTLQVLILARAWKAHTFVRFPYFYSYIASGTATGLAALFFLNFNPDWYVGFYWISQFFTLAVGCGLILEIFSHILSPYPGAERFARGTSIVTFALIFLFGFVSALMSSSLIARTSIEVERDIRVAQIVFFVAIVAVVMRYSIELGRNMRGMIYGYGLYLSVSLMSLALRSYVGQGFTTIWYFVQPFSFDAALLIWLVGFWAYYPNPAPKAAVWLEMDYEALAARTRRALGSARSQIGRVTRP